MNEDVPGKSNTDMPTLVCQAEMPCSTQVPDCPVVLVWHTSHSQLPVFQACSQARQKNKTLCLDKTPAEEALWSNIDRSNIDRAERLECCKSAASGCMALRS